MGVQMLYNSIFMHDKCSFSGHETFPLRYGWLKKAYDQIEEMKGDKKVFLGKDAIARFGVGKNMVAAIRHWGKETGFIMEPEGSKRIENSNIAESLLSERGLDPWLEEPTTLWLIHWNLCSNLKGKTTYYYLFNLYNAPIVGREELTHRLIALCEEKSIKYSAAILRRDVDCLVRTYTTKREKNGDFKEDNLESPLSELGLLIPEGREQWRLRRGNKVDLNDALFIYALLEFWQEYTEAKTLSLHAVVHQPGSPGRIFLLDEETVTERLMKVDIFLPDTMEWSETAGLRQVICHGDIEAIDKSELLQKAYNR